MRYKVNISSPSTYKTAQAGGSLNWKYIFSR